MLTATFNQTFNAPVPNYPEGLAFFLPFLEGHGAFVCDQDLALTVRIRDLNRSGVSPLLALPFSDLRISERLS
jgi:hypothetical protein